MTYSDDIPPICAPHSHTTAPQLSDGTYPPRCTTCGIDLEDYSTDELEELWWKDQVDTEGPPATDTELELDSNQELR